MRLRPPDDYPHPQLVWFLIVCIMMVDGWLVMVVLGQIIDKLDTATFTSPS